MNGKKGWNSTVSLTQAGSSEPKGRLQGAAAATLVRGIHLVIRAICAAGWVTLHWYPPPDQYERDKELALRLHCSNRRREWDFYVATIQWAQLCGVLQTSDSRSSGIGTCVYMCATVCLCECMCSVMHLLQAVSEKLRECVISFPLCSCLC